MPAWILGLQLGITLLTALQPEIEAAIAYAQEHDEDITPHTNAQTAVTNAISLMTNAIPAAKP
ncbi:MAG TPA: hypothetical protein VM782_05285 [Stellaceae bacterium]|nr:hypothetical protein [Stellaceae bacterium]